MPKSTPLWFPEASASADQLHSHVAHYGRLQEAKKRTDKLESIHLSMVKYCVVYHCTKPTKEIVHRLPRLHLRKSQRGKRWWYSTCSPAKQHETRKQKLQLQNFHQMLWVKAPLPRGKKEGARMTEDILKEIKDIAKWQRRPVFEQGGKSYGAHGSHQWRSLRPQRWSKRRLTLYLGAAAYIEVMRNTVKEVPSCRCSRVSLKLADAVSSNNRQANES
jgi:hypothetical protein